MIPSGLRLILLYDGMPQLLWPAKEPSEFLIHGADFSRLAPPGTSITDIKAVVVDGALTIGALTY